jgi:hypothetical protein
MITVTVAGNLAYDLHGFRTAPTAAPHTASDSQVRYVEAVALGGRTGCPSRWPRRRPTG